MCRIVLVGVSFLAVAILASESRGNIAIGDSFGGNLIFHETVQKYALPFIVRDEDITVKGVGSERIKAILVQDLEGHAESFIKDGGIGQHEVTIGLKSKRVVVVESKSVIVGQVYEQTGQVRKVFEKTVEATGIPLLKRDEEVYFEYADGDQKIKGIAIKDLENGEAQPAIRRGGLGFNSVTINLKSERGSGYKFLIEIYA
ncbi:hypothetical protein K1T71_012677 [Dendrolimus kikuchii]|uniref:Uncharacterized protein n=1 Tax=Dendrolimus kikuchii TaxID=765133 RepID=A0ACC1CK01_9NEOP|nr:hypothetical protein K1T71_012677 [Dendrolimus kikuchii]